MSECYFKKKLLKQVSEYYENARSKNAVTEYAERTYPKLEEFPTEDAVPVAWILSYIEAVKRLRDEKEKDTSEYCFFEILVEEIERMLRVRKKFEEEEDL